MTPSDRWKAFVRSPWLPCSILAIALFCSLGVPPLWGMEGRWGVICQRMMESGDYFNPKLMGRSYYDKPVLSYWLMIACARVLGGLTETALRIPSAVTALLSAWCLQRLAAKLWNREVARLALWMLVGCWPFVQFGRVGAADMLNVAAVVGAVAWYVERRDRPGFSSYAVFLSILAVGCLMKGLIAAVMAVLAILPDQLAGSRWKRHRWLALIPAAAVAAALYFAPFVAAGSHGGGSGLYQVFRENIVRYVDPFDHNKDSWTLYFKFLPLYLAPWSFFLPFVVHRAVTRWKELAPASRWVLLAAGVQFLFITLSSSRRPYYMLPLIPFAILAVADWIVDEQPRRPWLAAWKRRLLGASAGVVIAWFALLNPLSGRSAGVEVWSAEVRRAAEARAPWREWRIVTWGSTPTSAFYLHSPDDGVDALSREETRDELVARLKENPRTILLTRSRTVPKLEAWDIKGPVVEERARVPDWLAGLVPDRFKALTRDTDVAAAILIERR